MTAERSLEIIRDSIEQSRRDIRHGSWKEMMFWGVIVVLIAMVVAFLWKYTSMGAGANGLWVLCGIAYLMERYLFRKQLKKPITFVSKTLGYVWSSFGIMAGSLGILCGLIAFAHVKVSLPAMDDVVYLPITAIIILFMGLAGMITGRIINSRVVAFCCFLSGALGSVAAIIFRGPYEMIVLAVVGIVGLIIPALIMKGKEEEEAK